MQRAVTLAPGLALCLSVAVVAAWLAQQLGGPQVLYALVFGLVLNRLSRVSRLVPGLVACSRGVLRVGVALLGARISLPVLSGLGMAAAGLVAVGVVATVLVGLALSRLLRRPLHEGLISGGAVGICGVSAALAVSSVFPQRPEVERFTLMVAAGVTLLSSVAMIAYPMLAQILGLGSVATALFLGGSIHDVAQVVAAGLMLSQPVADSATVVKLFRVALLVPVVMFIALLLRAQARAGALARPTASLPGFLLAFCGLAVLGSAGAIPPTVTTLATEASRWMLAMAIAAIGIRTSPRELFTLGWVPVLMLLIESVFIAALVLLGIWLVALGA